MFEWCFHQAGFGRFKVIVTLLRLWLQYRSDTGSKQPWRAKCKVLVGTQLDHRFMAYLINTGTDEVSSRVNDNSKTKKQLESAFTFCWLAIWEHCTRSSLSCRTGRMQAHSLAAGFVIDCMATRDLQVSFVKKNTNIRVALSGWKALPTSSISGNGCLVLEINSTVIFSF